MHISTILNLLAVAGLVSSAPLDINGRDETFDLNQRDAQRIPLSKLGPIQPRPTATSATKSTTTTSSTTKSTTTSSSTTSSTTKSTTTSSSTTPLTTSKATTTSSSTSTTSGGIWTSVPQSRCPTSYPTAQPDFNTIPTSCGETWLNIVNMWRRAYGKKTFTWSAHSAQVAYGAAYNASGGAKPFKHSDLGYWGTNAEVETPGYVLAPSTDLLGVTPFSAAIINWLCEVPSDIQLQPSGYSGIDLCQKIQKDTDYIGETPGVTGHHDIILGDYNQIGCAFVFNTDNPTGPFAGIYVCDFQY